MMLAGILTAHGAMHRRARAEPLRLRADAHAQTPSPVGLVVLHGDDRFLPWVDAEAVAWLRAHDTPEIVGDVQTITVRLRDPGGRGEVRFGRFMHSAGAIRPMHLDGARVLARAIPTRTTLELFAGAPTAPRFGSRPFDLALGGRVAQSIGSWLTLGGAYVARRNAGRLLDEEAGPDLVVAPSKWFDMAGRIAFGLADLRPTDAAGSIGLRTGDLRIEVFTTHRSPGRMLPATSLFSVLGDLPSTTSGGTVRLRAWPRLELIATGAAVYAGGDLGGYATGRAVLALDDDQAGSLGVEVRRQDVGSARWSGVRGIAVLPLLPVLRLSGELEVVRPDVAPGASRVWPWGLVALAYRSASRWEAAAALEVAGTRDDRREIHALLRMSYAFERSR